MPAAASPMGEVPPGTRVGFPADLIRLTRFLT